MILRPIRVGLHPRRRAGTVFVPRSWIPIVVDAASDELTRPLGADRAEGKAPGRRFPAARFFAFALSGFAVTAIGLALWFGDNLGGVPHMRVQIDRRTDAPAPPQTEPAPAPPAETARRSADEVESASGVSVVRPAGTGAPASVFVRAPASGTGLEPAPDERLIEKSRYGLLPKTGPDGARPAEVYARPVGSLPGGAKVAGRIALVIGGLGISETATSDAITKLPPAVTLAFAPYGADVAVTAERARGAGHEIFLQVPMEPFDYPDSDPGPHTLTTAAKGPDNIEHLRWAMGRFTGYVGVMNYMGAKLTADAPALTPILKEIASRGLVTLDDGSSSRSLVSSLAGDSSARADVVLDAVARPDAIDKALQSLEAAALSRGFAIGTASALPVTLDRVQAWTRKLEARGILLVPASSGFGRGAREKPAERASR
jgi:polysaccharide deacetylase 2 family uncharacterized protein YibQ